VDSSSELLLRLQGMSIRLVTSEVQDLTVELIPVHSHQLSGHIIHSCFEIRTASRVALVMDLGYKPRMQLPLPPHVKVKATVTRASRLPLWRKWLAIYAVICVVALYSIEATHDHRSSADQLHCPVCHVVGHNALDSSTPELTPALTLSALFFMLLPVAATGLTRRAFFPKPQTRAPPISAL